MSMTNPITPPPELVQQWAAEARSETFATQHLCNQAARWGADRELDACISWLALNGYGNTAGRLRAAMLPKPPSLKEQALRELGGLEKRCDLQCNLAAIRRALEQLPDAL